MTAWYDNDALWRDLAPVIFTQERNDKAVGDVEQILTSMPLPPGASVLDVGCGVGRHALAFAHRGFQVTGIDRMCDYLESARARAQDQKVDIEFTRADMRQFRREHAFDLAVNLLTSFGYFDDPEDDLRVLANIQASLKPGGSVVIELMGREVLARVFRERDWQETPDGTILLEERKVTCDWMWIDLRWMIFRDGAQKEHRFRLRLYSATELKDLLTRAGFVDVRAYGSLSGGPYDQTAERLVVVGTRPVAV